MPKVPIRVFRKDGHIHARVRTSLDAVPYFEKYGFSPTDSLVDMPDSMVMGLVDSIGDSFKSTVRELRDAGHPIEFADTGIRTALDM